MQDSYVGDVGDFGKYALLKALSGIGGAGPRLRLGVVWYLTLGGNSGDGRFINYLTQTTKNAERFRSCDSVLCDELAGIVGRGDRNVTAIEAARVIGDDVAFYREILEPSTDRSSWLRRALETTRPCDVIFLDPDNGLRADDGGRLSPKHVYMNEVAAIAETSNRLKSAVIYHHLNRSATHQEQIDLWLRKLKDSFSDRHPFAMWYHRGTARAYFVLPAPEHEALLLQRARKLVAGRWGQGQPPHFQLVAP